MDLKNCLEGMSPKIRSTLKCIELPFYTEDAESKRRVSMLQEKFKLDILFGNNDALKLCHPGKGLVIATTNCEDNHTPCG